MHLQVNTSKELVLATGWHAPCRHLGSRAALMVDISSNLSSVLSSASCRTRLATRVSELLAVEEQPVLRLAVGAEGKHVWAATTAPSVHLWECEAAPELAAVGGPPTTPRSPLGGGALGGSCFIASPSASARARLSFDTRGMFVCDVIGALLCQASAD